MNPVRTVDHHDRTVQVGDVRVVGLVVLPDTVAYPSPRRTVDATRDGRIGNVEAVRRQLPSRIIGKLKY